MVTQPPQAEQARGVRRGRSNELAGSGRLTGSGRVTADARSAGPAPPGAEKLPIADGDDGGSDYA